jgi:O-acetyl-ADP-ribose deacetylase (regulator of RNase III)
MRKRLHSRIEVVQGDITKLKVDAIVNAANRSLLGGGGVDGAIHRAAGPQLLEECKKLNGCKTGSAKITKGYKLPAKFVIHAVGPVWHGGHHNEDELLANAYRKSLELATENKIRTIAFPSISTGVYGFPFERACKIALTVTANYLRENDYPESVKTVAFSKEDFLKYRQIYDEMFGEK